MRPERGLSSLTVSAVTVAVLLLLYPLSFGPACWLGARTDLLTGKWISTAYAPILWAFEKSPVPIQQAVITYANFGCGKLTVSISGGEVDFWEEVRILDLMESPEPFPLSTPSGIAP